MRSNIEVCAWNQTVGPATITIYYSPCDNLIAIGILASIQLMILTLWLILIVFKVLKHPTMTAKRSLNVPVHRLMSKLVEEEAEVKRGYPWAAQAALSRQGSSDSAQTVVVQEKQDEALARAMAIKEAEEWRPYVRQTDKA